MAKNMSPLERFWSHVSENVDTGCWVWRGCRVDGYGQFAAGHRKRIYAHRFAYLSLVGDIPAELQLDHLCRNRACVNPDHLEPVTPSVNVRRKNVVLRTACKRGHLFSEKNTYLSKKGRCCRKCHCERVKRAYAARKAAA